MHNSFILQQYVCYTTILNMFQAAYCSSSGGQIVFLGWWYQRLWWYNLFSWGWAAFCSKHVEDRGVTYILLKNKGIVHDVDNL